MKPDLNPLEWFLIKIWASVLVGLIAAFYLLNSAIQGLK